MPAGFSAMAGGTGIGYANRCMIWIGCLIVSTDMAVAAYGRCSGITVGVAQTAFYIVMSTSQRERSCIVVKPGRTSSVGVTAKACITVIRIPAYALMLLVHIILAMALEAAENSVISRIRMTVAAGIPLPVVRS